MRPVFWTGPGRTGHTSHSCCPVRFCAAWCRLVPVACPLAGPLALLLPGACRQETVSSAWPPGASELFILRLSRVDWLLQELHTCAVTSWPGRSGRVRQYAAPCSNPAVQGTGSWWLRPGCVLVAGHQVGVGAWGLSLKKIEHLKGGVSGIFLSTGPIYLIIDSSVLGCLCEHRKCKNNLWPWLTGQWYGCACLFFPSCSNLRIKAVVKECTARL